tara:strand:+ start:1020 stop:3899 length:2880 start_codon:yes stop_codon:yes gene_type:complete
MNRTITIIALLLAFILPLSAQKLNVAVIQFESEKISKSRVRSLTDRLRTELEDAGIYNVMDKKSMEDILDEGDFEYDDCISTDCAIEVGIIVGSDRIITGSMSRADKSYTISASIIDIESGKIINQHSIDCSCPLQTFRTETILQMAAALSVINEPEPIPQEVQIELTTPENGEQVTTLLPAFSWLAVTGAIQYEISLSENEGMSTAMLTTIMIWNEITNETNIAYSDDALPLQRGKTYYWQVIPLDENGDPLVNMGSAVFSVLMPPPIQPPDLISPGNGEQVTTLTLEFSWSSVKAVTQYEFSIYKDEELFSVLWSEATNNLRLVYPSDAPQLKQGNSYYWQVKPLDENGEPFENAASAVFSFFIPLPIQPAEIISPENGEQVTTLKPAFSWLPVTEATQYEIFLSEEKSMSPVLWSAITGTTNIIYQAEKLPLKGGQTYYWQVQSQDGDGNSIGEPSTVVSFLIPLPVQPPDLISPGNGEQVATLTPEFSWSSVKAAARYEFSLYEDEEMSSVLWRFEKGETNLTYPADAVSLKRGPNYYWQVIPLDAEGNKFAEGASIVSTFGIKEIPKLKQRKLKIEKPSERPVSVVNKVIGDLEKDRVADPGWKTAAWGDQLYNKDKVKTGDESFASLMFLDRTQMKIRENTVFSIEAERTGKKSLSTHLKVDKGDMWMKVPKTGSSFRIETPTSVASVKGTEFSLLVEEDGTTHLTVIEGTVEFMNEMGKILVEEMTTSIVALDVPPSPPKKVDKKTIKEIKEKVDVKEEFKLKLSESKPGAKEVGTEYNFTVEYLNIKFNTAIQTFKGEVIAKGSEGFQLSSDGGSSWLDEVIVTLNKGKGIFKGKGTTQGKKTISVTAAKVSPARLEFDMKQSKETVARINTKATKALEKIDPDIVSKIGNKKMKGGSVSRGAGNVEDVLEKVDSGEYEIIAQEVIENPDGSVRVIMRVKRQSSGKGAKGG